MSDRLYCADPSLASFEAHVSDIREVSRSQGRSLWQIALDRSAFYPTSGGQPHDTGMLTATSSGGALLEAPILAVEEDKQGEVWHTTPKPLLAGTAVRGYVDWSRRRDHMQQHSGQHLLGIRVEFVCGMRGAVTARRDLATLTRAASALSVGHLEVAEPVERLLTEGKAAHKARQKLTEEMAGYYAPMLLLDYSRSRAAE
jgi:Ser-tRNA(Ala) deacylase AlaX